MEHVPYHSPPKNMASKQLLEQLHNSPNKGSGQRREEGQGGRQRNRQGSGYKDPYLANNNSKRKNHRGDSFVSEDVRYRDQRNSHSDNRQWRDESSRDVGYRDSGYHGNRDHGYHGSPRKNYREDHSRGGYPHGYYDGQHGYHDNMQGYHDNAHGYHDNTQGYDARGEMHYRERPREGNFHDQAPNSFLSHNRPGYQPQQHRPTNETPNFESLKRRPGKGRGSARSRN